MQGSSWKFKAEESIWEGALERLLRADFGISLLVPQAHLWRDCGLDGAYAAGLQRRNIVYKRYTDSGFLELDEEAACRKLNLKEDSPFYNWLAAELVQRFRHICCDTMKEFQQTKYALTRAGQVKLNGGHGRKG